MAVIEQAAFPVLAALGGQGAEFWELDVIELLQPGGPAGVVGLVGVEILASLWQRRVAEAALAPPIEPGVEIARKEFKPLVFAADGDLLGFACGAEASETLHCRG